MRAQGPLKPLRSTSPFRNEKHLCRSPPRCLLRRGGHGTPCPYRSTQDRGLAGFQLLLQAAQVNEEVLGVLIAFVSVFGKGFADDPAGQYFTQGYPKALVSIPFARSRSTGNTPTATTTEPSRRACSAAVFPSEFSGRISVRYCSS